MGLVASITALAQSVAADIKSLLSSVAGKQNTLVSGTNIKTVFGNSLLGTTDISSGNLTGALNEAPMLTLASAATVAIGAAAANTLKISGTTPITAFDILASGERKLIFTGITTLTHNATSLILPGAANITTAANDVATVVTLGGGNWQCTEYVRAAVSPDAVTRLNTARNINGVPFDGTANIAVSLTDFTDTLNSAGVNATVPIAALVVTGTATNIDAAGTGIPKGTGAFALAIADGTATGGNKRGTKAVDLQLLRGTAAQVASGTYSFAAGMYNTASGQGSVALGESNSASGQDSFAMGNGNAATGNYAVAMGVGIYAPGQYSTGLGNSSTTSGQYSFAVGNLCTSSANYAVAMGQRCTSSGIYSIATGNCASTRGVTGAFALGCGASSVIGQLQIEQFVLAVNTSGAVATRITSDGLAASAINGPVLPNTSTYDCRLRIIARNTATGDSAKWSGDALIHREANAAATSFTGTPALTSDFMAAGMTGCTVALNADTTLGALGITVTGLASTNIRWVAHVETLEATN